MKNFDIKLAGPKNMWSEPGSSVTLFSASWEVFFDKKKFAFIAAHLWLFGFQIFEFFLARKRK